MIQTREQFIEYVRALAVNLRDSPDEWTNHDLAAYLEALGAWVEDLEGYYRSRGEPVPEQPTWRTLAEILFAAKVYE